MLEGEFSSALAGDAETEPPAREVLELATVKADGLVSEAGG
jgi:hypothetical protein